MALGLTDHIWEVGDILRKPLIVAAELGIEDAEKQRKITTKRGDLNILIPLWELMLRWTRLQRRSAVLRVHPELSSVYERATQTLEKCQD